MRIPLSIGKIHFTDKNQLIFFLAIWLLRILFLPITLAMFLRKKLIDILVTLDFVSKYEQMAVVTTGGTGGHILPALRTCYYFTQKKRYVCFYTNKLSVKFIEKMGYIGQHTFQQTESPLDSTDSIIIKFHNIIPLSKKWKSLYCFIASILQAILYIVIQGHTIKCVIGFGGYASFPLVCCGAVLFRKVYLHEQNTTFGKVNRIFLPFATKCFTAFNLPVGCNVVHSGMPLTKESESRGFVSKHKNDTVNILVISGSSGGAESSKTIISSLILFARHHTIKVFYQANGEVAQHVKDVLTKHNIQHDIRPFFQKIYTILPHINLAISRSGASSIVDLLTFGIPTVFIPLQYSAENHQMKNALWVVKNELGYIFKPWESNSYNLTTLLKIALANNNIAKRQVAIKRKARDLIYSAVYK